MLDGTIWRTQKTTKIVLAQTSRADYYSATLHMINQLNLAAA